MKLVAGAAEMRAIPRSDGFRNGGVSLWYRETGLPARRAPLAGSADYDVCVVGAGFTGLWTAYYLKKEQPDLRVAVLEREFAGFGASGRNGGRLSADFPGGHDRYSDAHRKGSLIALQRAVMDSVDEVVDVAAREGIDADIVKGGIRLVATNAAQRERLVERVAHLQEWGYWPEDLYLLDEAEIDGEPPLRVAGVLAAAHSPHAARVHPAKLATGLAAAVVALGVDLFEDTEVIGITPGSGSGSAGAATAVTARGTVRAEYVLRATEGYTATLDGQRRNWLPTSGSMIATEPIGAELWERIGWDGREVLGDVAHAQVYAQRTADDRIAIGGRVAPYRFASDTDRTGATAPQAIAELWRGLVRMFPSVAEVPVAHAWSGLLGVPCDRTPSVGLDRETGLGWAGGYLDSGIGTANLAGRTLRDLVLRRGSGLTGLPWVGHETRQPDAEPLRRLGARFAHGLHRGADRAETGGGPETSRLARMAARLTGH